jgi:hypothetical protein
VTEKAWIYDEQQVQMKFWWHNPRIMAAVATMVTLAVSVTMIITRETTASAAASINADGNHNSEGGS